MLSEQMQRALNGQCNAELYSSYLYLSMSAYFHSVGLAGFANWMRVQAQEELAHAMKFFDFVNGRGGRAVMQTIEAPTAEWGSPLAAFEAVLRHEQKVTGLINGLVNLALKEGDHATHIFLQWFVSEQVEEEASAGEVVQKLRLAGESTSALLLLDKELGARVFTPPGAGASGSSGA
jgi:ferritin